MYKDGEGKVKTKQLVNDYLYRVDEVNFKLALKKVYLNTKWIK